MRIGHGYDLHRLVANRPLIIGGITIPHDRGLLGHSDADVLAHAVTDALLGAAAMGNIGQHFPDSDPQFKDADSMTLLKTAWAMVSAKGYRIENIDATIIAERPKLGAYIERIRDNIASYLQIEVERVSVKAKTNEGVGPEGRQEAISVHAVALLTSALSP